MEKQIVDKTSFSEICKILKDNKYDICECINGVFEVALLFSHVWFVKILHL